MCVIIVYIYASNLAMGYPTLRTLKLSIYIDKSSKQSSMQYNFFLEFKRCIFTTIIFLKKCVLKTLYVLQSLKV